MKKLLLAVVLLVSAFSGANAQIQNPDFENWQNDTISGLAGPVAFRRPVSWTPFLSAVLTTLSGRPVPIAEATPGYNSAKALKLTSDTSGGSDIFGLFPIGSSAPSTFSVYLKSEGSFTASDSVAVSIALKGTYQGKDTTVAAGGNIITSGISNGFSRFDFPITSISNVVTPDSAMIAIIYLNASTPGNSVIVDAVSFSGTLTSNGKAMNQNLNIAPNPATTELRVSGLVAPTSYAIYSVDGKKVKTGIATAETSIDVASLSPGVYNIEIRRGGRPEVRRFVKQ